MKAAMMDRFQPTPVTKINARSGGNKLTTGNPRTTDSKFNCNFREVITLIFERFQHLRIKVSKVIFQKTYKNQIDPKQLSSKLSCKNSKPGLNRQLCRCFFHGATP
jgi:hypothetical protein